MTRHQDKSQLPPSCRLTLLLIRHGKTEANQTGVIQGHADSPLTEVGIRSSVVKADKLAPFPVSAIYCSDLPRARSTLAIIQKRSPDLPAPTFTSVLREIDFGEYTGSVKQDIWETIKRHKSTTSIKYPGGESGDDLRARVEEFIHDACRRHHGEHVLAISHYGVIETMVKRYAGFPAEDYFQIDEETVVVLGFDGATAGMTLL